jgi:hypothetical protein
VCQEAHNPQSWSYCLYVLVLPFHSCLHLCSNPCDLLASSPHNNHPTNKHRHKLLLIAKLNLALVTAYLPAFFAVYPLHSGLITTSKERFGDGSTSAANASQNPLSAATVEIRQWPDYLVTLLPNTVHSCSRHGVVAVRFTSERPSNVIPVSKTFVLFKVYL